MKEPPPPPPKPQLTSKASLQSTDSISSCLASKYPQSEYNLIQKIDSNSTLTAPAQYQPQNFYANTGTISSTNGYGSLLCHSSSTASPLAVRKRDKLLHRFSDAATLGRKLKKKKNTNRTCRSMTEAIEMLADPVIEDEFFVSIYLNSKFFLYGDYHLKMLMVMLKKYIFNVLFLKLSYQSSSFYFYDIESMYPTHHFPI